MSPVSLESESARHLGRARDRSASPRRRGSVAAASTCTPALRRRVDRAARYVCRRATLIMGGQIPPSRAPIPMLGAHPDIPSSARAARLVRRGLAESAGAGCGALYSLPPCPRVIRGSPTSRAVPHMPIVDERGAKRGDVSGCPFVMSVGALFRLVEWCPRRRRFRCA
jgi:hypothetical protein